MTFDVSRNDEGTAALLQALQKRRPDLEIAQKTPQEMRRLVSGPNLKALLPHLGGLLFTVFFAVWFLPWIIHGFDSGHRTVDVADFYSPDFESHTRNLTVIGRPHPEVGMIHSREYKGARVKQIFIPMVSEDWQPGDPVAVLVRTSSLDEQTRASLQDAREISGVLRDIWREGISADNQRLLSDEVGLKLAESIYVIQYDPKPKRDLVLALAFILIVAFLSFIVAQALHHRMGGL